VGVKTPKGIHMIAKTIIFYMFGLFIFNYFLPKKKRKRKSTDGGKLSSLLSITYS